MSWLGEVDSASNKMPRWLWWIVVVTNVIAAVWGFVVLITTGIPNVFVPLNIWVVIHYVNSSRLYHAQRKEKG